MLLTVTMDLRHNAPAPSAQAAKRKPSSNRRVDRSAVLDGYSLGQAISLPLHTAPAQAPLDALTDRASVQRVPNRMGKLRQILLVGDAIIAAGCCALAVVSNSVPMGVAAAVWFVALMGATVTGSPHDVNSLRRALLAGVFAVSILSVTAVFKGGPADPAVRHGIFALALGTLAAVSLRLIVRAVPAASALAREDESVLLVGDPHSLQSTIRQWRLTGDDHRIVGACVTGDRANREVAEVEGVAVLGGLSDAPAAALRSQANSVAVLPGPGMSGESVRKLGWALEPSGVELSMVTPLLDVASHRAHADVVGRQLLVRVSHSVPAGVQAALKGALDRTLAALLLVMTFPVLAVIALAVRLDSSGPALFRQIRIREGGRSFTMLKFRTMHVDAEQARHALVKQNDHGSSILFKMRDDPRVTRVGRVLRATSLDELPQLVNVLKGEMSLVGPRPALPSEVAQYDERAQRRLAVKPGLTGLWQVSGRANLTWEESLRMDLAYVDNWRHGIDLRILLCTARAVLRRDGAH